MSSNKGSPIKPVTVPADPFRFLDEPIEVAAMPPKQNERQQTTNDPADKIATHARLHPGKVFLVSRSRNAERKIGYLKKKYPDLLWRVRTVSGEAGLYVTLPMPGDTDVAAALPPAEILTPGF
jgi:hypothetical protein